MQGTTRVCDYARDVWYQYRAIQSLRSNIVWISRYNNHSFVQVVLQVAGMLPVVLCVENRGSLHLLRSP